MELHYLLMADHTFLQKMIMAQMKTMGLTPGQPKVLDFLREHDGAMQKDIAQGCLIEPSSLSVVLNGMEKKGLLTRTAQEDNRRMMRIFLSEKGKQVCAQLHAHFLQAEQQALAGFSTEEAVQLQTLLEKVYQNLSGGEQANHEEK